MHTISVTIHLLKRLLFIQLGLVFTNITYKLNLILWLIVNIKLHLIETIEKNSFTK